MPTLTLRLYFIIALLYIGPLATGQQLIQTPTIDLITEADGLPFNSAVSLLQDRNGFVWVSSMDGVARYDGYSFTTIVGSPQLPNQSVFTMVEDKNGFLWLGHQSGYITRLNPTTFETEVFFIPAGRESEVSRMFIDAKGTLWVFVAFVGLYKFDGQNKFDFVSAVPNLPSYPNLTPNWFNNIGCFAETPDGFWFGTSNGLFFFNPRNNEWQQQTQLKIDGEYPIAILSLIVQGDEVWMGTYGFGLIRFNIITKKWKSFSYQQGARGTTNIINSVLRKNDDEIWLATNGKGIGLFDKRSERFTFFHKPYDFDSGPLCSSLIQDRSGILWSVSDKGLFKWNTQSSKFVFTTIIPVRSDNGVYYGATDILQMKDSLLLIGTNMTNGLLIRKGNQLFMRDFSIHRLGEPFKLVQDIHRQRDGKVWIVTRDNIFLLTEKIELIPDLTINRLLNEERVPFFRYLMETKEGELWVASSRNGLFRKSIDGIWHQEEAGPNGIKNNRVLKIVEDDKNRKWILHAVEGISRYDPATKKYEYVNKEALQEKGFLTNKITDITTAPNGDVWISSVEGVYVFGVNSDSVKARFTLAEGLPTEVFYSICMDDAGNAWLTSSKGLVAIQPNGEIKLFDYIDGIRGISASMYMRQGSDGLLHVVTYQGFYTFDPKEVLRPRQEVHVPKITSVRNQGQSVLDFGAKQNVEIAYDKNSVTIEFSALNFLNPARNEYLYKMDGLDNDWIATNQHIVNYAGIPSGSYQFRVRLKGQAEADQAMLKIVIETPFYRQKWFLLIVIAMLTVFGFFLYRARLKQVRKEERVSADFKQKLTEVEMKALRAQMNPHFIFNSLNSINRYIVKSDPDTASLYLTKFSKLIRLILDNSNNKVISLDQELKALSLYIELEALRFNNKFTYHLQVDSQLDASMVGVPPLIIQPFIENAIWHGLLHKDTQGHLQISVNKSEDGIVCIIEDNGVGRKKAFELKSKSISVSKSYGMKITSDRLNMLSDSHHTSSVKIEDLADEFGNALGTRVIIKIAMVELESEI